MKFKDFLIRLVRKVFQSLSRKRFPNPDCIFDRKVSNDLIYNLLQNDKPCMIARLGTTELITVNNYLCINGKDSLIKKVFRYITDKTHTPWWDERNFKFLEIYSGVFPPNKSTSERFAKLYLNDIPMIDILGSFQYYEKFLPLKGVTQFLQLETLYPFFVENPWTRALKGKKVLVVHPFEATIIKQYRNRKNLFINERILPDFELITLKAVQSAAEVKTEFEDWFQALDKMKNQIREIEFDICLLGCGAYGLPLAAHVKSLGKKAIHLGGGLQLLFGIKGKRWDNPNYGIEEFRMYPNLMSTPYCSLYNENWIRPLKCDTPITFDKLDGGTYW